MINTDGNVTLFLNRNERKSNDFVYSNLRSRVIVILLRVIIIIIEFIQIFYIIIYSTTYYY